MPLPEDLTEYLLLALMLDLLTAACASTPAGSRGGRLALLLPCLMKLAVLT